MTWLICSSISNRASSKEADEQGPDNIQASEGATKRTEEAKDTKDDDKEEKDKKEKLPPLTKEETEKMKAELVTIMQAHIDNMKDKEWTDEEGKYTEEAKKVIYGFYISYFALKRAPLEDLIESRRQIAQIVLNSDFITKVAGVVIDIYPKGWANEEKKTDMLVWKPLSNSMLFLQNYSDASHEFALRVGNTPGYLEMIRRILVESIEAHLKQDQPVGSKLVM